MITRVRRWLSRGQTPCFQYYATVHPLTCEVCLSHHGEISFDLDGSPQPPLHPDCRCSLLEFPTRELEHYQERGLRMKEKANRELQRRWLFRQASEALSRSPSEAVALFQQSIQIDIYLEDIEALCHEQDRMLRASPGIARQVRDLLLKAYGQKFDSDKYQPLPEGMKSARRAHGLKAIQDLFQKYTLDSQEA